MGAGEEVVLLGYRLRAIACSLSGDSNERLLLVHQALAGILRDDPSLVRPHSDAYALRTALWAARWRATHAPSRSSAAA
jgi:hypothetical protein